MKKTLAIALSSFHELIRQPVWLILGSGGVVFMVVLAHTNYFALGEESRQVKQSVLAFMLVSGLVAAVLGASSSVARETRSGTAMIVLSKPIGRFSFLLGKYVGLILALSLLGVLHLLAALMAGRMARESAGSYVVAFVFTCARGAMMAWLHRGNRLGSDVAIGASYVSAFALGVLLLSWKRHYTGHLETLFFGTLLAVHPFYCVLLVGLAAVIAGFQCVLRHSLERWCFDEELAIAAGVPVEALRAGTLVLIAASVVLSVKIVGLLLVTSLLILPGAIGSLMARTSTGILCVSLGAALVATTGGLVVSNAVDAPPGPASVVLAFALFLAAFVSTAREPRSGTNDAPAPPSPVVDTRRISPIDAPCRKADSNTEHRPTSCIR